MATAKEREEFVAQLTRALPQVAANLVARNARLLMRHAKTHGNIAEAQCNGPGDYVNSIPYPEAGRIYREFEERCAKREARIEARISAICAELGIEPDFGGDPRGYTVKVKLPTGASNTWGGASEGWGIPQ